MVLSYRAVRHGRRWLSIACAHVSAVQLVAITVRIGEVGRSGDLVIGELVGRHAATQPDGPHPRPA